MKWIKLKENLFSLLFFLLTVTLFLFVEYTRFQEGGAPLDVFLVSAEFEQEKDFFIDGDRVVTGETGIIYHTADSFFEFLMYRDAKIILDSLTVIFIIVYVYLFIRKENKYTLAWSFPKNKIYIAIYIPAIMVIIKLYAFRWIGEHFKKTTQGKLELDIGYEPYSTLILLLVVLYGIDFLINDRSKSGNQTD